MTAILPFEAEAIRLIVDSELAREVLDAVLAAADAATSTRGGAISSR